MKTIILLTACIALLLTGCSTTEDITVSSEPPSSMAQSSDTPSEPTSSLPQSSDDSSELTPSTIENSSMISSDAPSSALPVSLDSKAKHSVKSVTLGSGYMTNAKINYNLSKTEIDEFVKHWKGMELEFLQSHKRVDGLVPPGYGSGFLCRVAITYTDKKDVTYFSFDPNYHENSREYKITSGAKEMFGFISSLDCYKKAKIDLYAIWLEESKTQSSQPTSSNTQQDVLSSSKVQVNVTDVNGLPVPDVGCKVFFVPQATDAADAPQDYVGTTDSEGNWTFTLFQRDSVRRISSLEVHWSKAFHVTSTVMDGRQVESVSREKAGYFEAYTGNPIAQPAPDKTVVINLVMKEVVPQY